MSHKWKGNVQKDLNTLTAELPVAHLQCEGEEKAHNKIT